MTTVSSFLNGFKPPARFLSSDSNRRIFLLYYHLLNIDNRDMEKPGLPGFRGFSHVFIFVLLVDLFSGPHLRHLSHYSASVGQWYRVLGKCISILGTPGSSDYFQAANAGNDRLVICGEDVRIYTIII